MTVRLPESTESSPARSFYSVRLPVPFAPTSPTRSPDVTIQSRSWNRVLEPKRLPAPVSWIIGYRYAESIRLVPQNFSRQRTGGLSVFHHGSSVHHDQLETFGILVRIFESRCILY